MAAATTWPARQHKSRGRAHLYAAARHRLSAGPEEGEVVCERGEHSTGASFPAARGPAAALPDAGFDRGAASTIRRWPQRCLSIGKRARAAADGMPFTPSQPVPGEGVGTGHDSDEGPGRRSLPAG